MSALTVTTNAATATTNTSLNFTTIDDPGEAQTQLYGINTSGEIVGAGLDGAVGVGGPVHSFIVGVGNFDVGALDLSAAIGVNDSGKIVGTYYDGAGHSYFDVGGSITTIFTGSNVTGIDDAGDIVGLNAAQQPFIDIGGTVTLLGTSAATGIAISANGTIAISSASGSVKGTLSGGFHAVNAPAGAIVQGINDEGQIVGWVPSENGGLGGGFLMNADGTFLQINIPGANGTRAEGINDSGAIVGYYFDASNNEHGFETTVGAVEAANGVAPSSPVIAAPAATTVAIGKTVAIPGVSISESSAPQNETFTVKLTDTNGHLAATGAGVKGAGTNSLTISGTLNQVNSDLATLTDRDAVAATDIITINATDSNGGKATPATIMVTVSGPPAITAPTSVTVEQKLATAVSGISIAEPGATSGETFTVVVRDGSGTLAASGAGVIGSGTKSLTISGTLAEVNSELATLTDADSSTAADTIKISASDSFGNKAIPGSISVGVAPPSNVINMGSHTSVVFYNLNTLVNAKGFNLITGGDGNDTVAAGGNTTVSLGNGSDTVSVGLAGLVMLGNGNDTVSAGSLTTIKVGNGNDTVTGGDENQITVGNGNDTIHAGNWPKGSGLEDIINLGNGTDTVFMGAGETINLGGGQDTLVFGVKPTPGYDQVNNFSSAHDIIEFNKALFANYAAVLGATQQVGHDTQIVLDVSDIITLTNVQASSLHASNFKFV